MGAQVRVGVVGAIEGTTGGPPAATEAYDTPGCTLAHGVGGDRASFTRISS